MVPLIANLLIVKNAAHCDVTISPDTCQHAPQHGEEDLPQAHGLPDQLMGLQGAGRNLLLARLDVIQVLLEALLVVLLKLVLVVAHADTGHSGVLHIPPGLG